MFVKKSTADRVKWRATAIPIRVRFAGRSRNFLSMRTLRSLCCRDGSFYFDSNNFAEHSRKVLSADALYAMLSRRFGLF